MRWKIKLVISYNLEALQTATFQLFAWKSTKNPYKSVVLNLKNGRIYLRGLLLDEVAIKILKCGTDELLQQDESGFSIQSWESGSIYQLRIKKRTSVDIDISFSEKDKTKINIMSVRDDFGIVFDNQLLTLDNELDNIPFPAALSETIGLYAKFNTLRLESTRRSIASLFLHYSISTVPNLGNKLCIDEESPLSLVKQVSRDGESKIAKYHGPVDFVIGHSKLMTRMPNDAAVIVIEIKKSDTFSESLHQVVAQAASLLLFRKEQIPPRGLNGSGGPIFFVRTDGERWIFSKLFKDDRSLRVQHSHEVKLNILEDKIESEKIQEIFDWLRFLIKSGRDSSPRTSTTEQNMTAEIDESVLSCDFLDLNIQ